MKWYDSIMTKVKSIFNLAHDASESEVDAALAGIQNHEQVRDAIRQELEAEHQQSIAGAIAEAKQGNDALQAGLAHVESQNEKLQGRITDLEAQITQLQADLTAANGEVERLKKEPAATHTGGATDTDTGKAKSKTPVWDAFRAANGIQ
jgi:uncharacterized phage infection (PIP) family protein YhgE